MQVIQLCPPHLQLMATSTLYHKPLHSETLSPPFSQDNLQLITAFYTSNSSVIKFFFFHLNKSQQLQGATFSAQIKGGQVSEKPGPCPLMLPTTGFLTPLCEDCNRPQLPQSLIAPREGQLFEAMGDTKSSVLNK